MASRDRRPVPVGVRRRVLLEAGYKCAVPTCFERLTLEIHHIVWVRDGGGSVPANLIALCPTCHALHTRKHIPPSAIRDYKRRLEQLFRGDGRRRIGPRPRDRARHVNLLDNGSFEKGLRGWGTGWIEDIRSNQPVAWHQGFLLSGGAVARWYPDRCVSRPSGLCSLRIEHRSAYAPQVYSTLSQRLRVERGRWYELSLWVNAEEVSPLGGLSVLVSAEPADWEDQKLAVDPGTYRWRRHGLRFNTGSRSYVDIRFVAEGTVRAWIDDVVVRHVRDGGQMGKDGIWLLRHRKA